MGNKKNSRVKHKNRGGDRLEEWRVLKSFGLAKPDRLCETEHNPQVTVSDVENHQLIVEAERGTSQPTGECAISGRRIVDIAFFLKELTSLSEHCPQFGCTLANVNLKLEIKKGLRSGFLFECSMCGLKRTVWSEPQAASVLDINRAAVAGTMSFGGGFAALEKLMGAMNVRCMSSKTYDRCHDTVSNAWEETALKEMREAAEEESKLARERGDVDQDGTPLLTVVTDGSWAKRSYRKNYNSLSGMAAIVGYHTRKVLYFGVKNKYCISCVRLSNQASSPKENHVCFKNWTGSSSSMEAAVIVEGFLASEQMYGVRYAKMIADGDSSVYHNVLTARPYDNITVTKIECRNHLLRNYCNKLKDIATTSVRGDKPDFDRGLHLKMRRLVGSRILRCRYAVTKAISYRKVQEGSMSSKSTLLRKDILNGPSHVFGEHMQCKSIGYFCNGPQEGEINYVPDMKKCGLYTHVMELVNCLADNSNHLIEDVDSNRVEHYNASIAKFTGGKRINFTQRRSYQARCAAAVVSHNTGKAFYKLHKTLIQSSPGEYGKQFENRTKRKSQLASLRNIKKPKVRRSLKMSEGSVNDKKNYGCFAQKPDIEEGLYRTKVDEHMIKIKKTKDEILELEEATRNQNRSQLWLEERRLRLTASNFGLICNRKPHSKCGPVVNKLLYSYVNGPALEYGRTHEKEAIQELEVKLGIKVKECGLFVDEELPFLAASPDGLVGEDGLIEVKCPASAADLTPDEVIDRSIGVVGKMWKKTGINTYQVKAMHPYHLQVQGQLHITNRTYCLFTIWTPKGIKVEKIIRDDELWRSKMKGKLETFYMHCLLPELIDPRRRRSKDVREPDYIIQAQQQRKESVLAMPLRALTSSPAHDCEST